MKKRRLKQKILYFVALCVAVMVLFSNFSYNEVYATQVDEQIVDDSQVDEESQITDNSGEVISDNSNEVEESAQNSLRVNLNALRQSGKLSTLEGTEKDVLSILGTVHADSSVARNNTGARAMTLTVKDGKYIFEWRFRQKTPEQLDAMGAYRISNTHPTSGKAVYAGLILTNGVKTEYSDDGGAGQAWFYDLNGNGYEDEATTAKYYCATANTTPARVRKKAGTDTIDPAGTGDVPVNWYTTITDTGYLNRNVYVLNSAVKMGTAKISEDEAEELGITYDSNEYTVKVTLTEAQYKKLLKWCKSNNMPKEGDSYVVYPAISGGVKKLENGAWLYSSCSYHGVLWRNSTLAAGNGVSTCDQYKGGQTTTAVTIGSTTTSFDGDSYIVQDDDECRISAYSTTKLLLPPVVVDTAEVELIDRAGSVVLNDDYELKEYALDATAKVSDWGTTPTYVGYTYSNATADTKITATHVSDGLTMYRNYTKVPYTVKCVDRYYKGGTFVEKDYGTAKTLYVDGSLRGSSWGKTPLSGYESYVYKDDTKITLDTKTITAAGSGTTFTVYRNFNAQSFNVVYHANGGTGSPAKQTPYVGDAVTLYPTNVVSRTSTYGAGNWKNTGWSTASGATNSVTYAPSAVQTFSATAGQTINLYAVWQPSLKTVLESGVTSVTVSGEEFFNNYNKYYTYNQSLALTGVELGNGRHLQSIEINGTEQPAMLNALKNGTTASMTMNDCKTLRLVPTQNAAQPKKNVYKKGTSTDINKGLVAVGDELTYKITITNTTDVARDYVISDTPDSGVTYIAGSASDNGSYANGTITWNITQLAPGEETAVSFDVKVNATKEGLKIVNIAKTVEKAIAALGETDDLIEYSKEVENFVMKSPEKHLRKTGDSTQDMDNVTMVEGEEGYYTITVENPSVEAKTFTIKDEIPVGFTIGEISDGGTKAGQFVTWSVSVPGQGEKTVSVQVTANDESFGQTVYNEAKVSVDTANLTSNKVKTHFFLPPVKDAYLTLNEDGTVNTQMQSIHKRIIRDGVLVTYRIEYENPTDGVRELVIKDTVPEYARIATAADLERAMNGENLALEDDIVGGGYLISDNGTYDEITEEITWNVTSESSADEKDSGFVEFTVVILRAAGGNHVKNTAQLTMVSPAGLNENNPTAHSNEVDTPVLAVPDKIATRKDGVDVSDLVVNDGDEITYKITFSNPAEEEKAFIVTDIVPEFTSLVEGSISDGGTYDTSENLVTWNVTLAPGETKTVSFTVIVLKEAQNQTVRNTARVIADDASVITKDDVPTNIYILEDPKKAVLNVDGEDINGLVKRAGDILTYEIVYKNPAPDERIATITDKLPQGLEFISAEHQGSLDTQTGEFVDVTGAYSYAYDKETGTVTWQVPTAGNCQEMAIVAVRIKEEARGTILRNVASVFIPDATKQTNEVSNPVLDNPKKESTDEKGQDPAGKLVTVGEKLTYTVTVTNPSDMEKIAFVTDKLPQGVDFISADGKGAYDASSHTVFWKNVTMAAGEVKTFHVVVRVNKEARETVIHNEVVFRIDDAVTSSELTDGGAGGPQSYVTSKAVYNAKGKEIDGNVVTAGNLLVYKISYKNISEKEQLLTIMDTLPEGVAVKDIGDGGYILTSPIPGLEEYAIAEDRTVAWQFYVGPKEEGYVTVTVEVNTQAKDVIENQAVLMIYDDNNPNEKPFIKETNKVVNPIIQPPVKMVFNDKGEEITDKMVATNDTITYKITYVNPSDETKYADMKDYLPKEVTFVSCDHDGVYDKTSHTVNWTELETKAGERMTVSVVVKVKDNAGGKTIGNKASMLMDEAVVSARAKVAESTEEDPKPSDKTVVENYVACKKTYDANGTDISGEIVKVGDAITYRIRFKNTSQVEKQYTIKDVLPQEVDYVSSSEEPQIEGNTLTWTKTLPASSEGFIDVVVTINEKGYGKKIENRADITENDPQSFDVPYTVTTTPTTNYVFDEDDFTKTVEDKKGKSLDGGITAAGEELSFGIKLHNPSEEEETFVVTDKLDERVIFVSATKGGTYDKETHTVTWEFTLGGGAQANLAIIVKVKNSVKSGCIENTAHLTCDGTEHDTNTTNTYLLERPIKSMSIGSREVADGAKVEALSNLCFAISYSNPTKEDREITVTDVVDKRLVDAISIISDDGVLTDGTITWNLFVPAGQSGEVYFTVVVPEELVGQEISNTATVTLDHDGMSGNTSLDTNTVHFTVVQSERNSNDPSSPSNPKNNIVQTGDFVSWIDVVVSFFK